MKSADVTPVSAGFACEGGTLTGPKIDQKHKNLELENGLFQAPLITHQAPQAPCKRTICELTGARSLGPSHPQNARKMLVHHRTRCSIGTHRKPHPDSALSSPGEWVNLQQLLYAASDPKNCSSGSHLQRTLLAMTNTLVNCQTPAKSEKPPETTDLLSLERFQCQV